jgi:hypothetical protein
MARKSKPKAIPLAEVRAGDAFLAPLEDGRLSVCRILRTSADHDHVLVTASPWVGTQPPDLADPRLREVLRLTHHSWRGNPEVSWVSDPVPATFARLGEIPPTDAEATANSNSNGNWEYFRLQVLLQWRWDNERDKVLAEDAEEQRAAEAAREEERRAYQPRPAQTLEDMRPQVPFKNWAGYVDPPTLRGARRIIRETIDALIELGPGASEPAMLDEIRHCVERFNLLDEEQQFIETVEREDICELLDDLAGLVGLDDYGEALASARDW